MASKKALKDIWGIEHDWVGGDADGHVAFFSTAGGGFAPPEYLEDIDVHRAAIATILALPASTTCRFAPPARPHDQVNPSLSMTWRLVAERGLYAFDSDPNGYPYKLIAAPARPISLDDLPPIAAAVVQRIIFPRLHCIELSENSKIEDSVLQIASK